MLLSYLFSFLFDLSLHVAQTKMTPENLAIGQSAALSHELGSDLCLLLVSLSLFCFVRRRALLCLALSLFAGAVFAPNLIRPKIETPQSMMTEMPSTISVISTFISECHTIFGAAGPAGPAVGAGVGRAHGSI